LNIPKTVVLRILKEDLGKKKLCARFVLQSFTPEQMEGRVTYFQDITAKVDEHKNFNKIMTADETWCLAYDPETKGQRFECLSETSPRPNELKFQTSRKTNMLIIFSSLKA
jgi:hypothetical protein